MCDLISRQAAIEEILGCCPSDPFGSEYECGYDDGLRQGVHRIKHLPTIDAVPVVHGEWLPYEFCTDGTWDKCSVCGVAHRTRSKYTGYIDGKEYTIQDRMNYCPNCGAKMDGERKDDEGS